MVYLYEELTILSHSNMEKIIIFLLKAVLVVGIYCYFNANNHIYVVDTTLFSYIKENNWRLSTQSTNLMEISYLGREEII